MLASARLVVQMTPKEKQSLDGRAKRAGLSTAEFVRRRVNADDLDDQRDEIEALLASLEATAPRILRALDNSVATATALIAALDQSAIGSRS